MTASQVANAVRIIAQVAAALPALDSGWTTHYEFIVDNADEPLGQQVGQATMRVHNSYGWLPNKQSTASPAVIAPAQYTGYVRLLKTDPSGTITVDGVTYTAFWWGIFDDWDREPNGDTVAAGYTVYKCLGLPAILDQIYIDRGYEINYHLAPTANSVVDPGHCPAFNDTQTNGQFGDRYTSTVTINGHSVYCHDRSSAGVPWTAKQLLDLLLAGFAQQTTALAPTTVLGATWSAVCEQTTNLDYLTDKMEFAGKSLLFAINSIVNPRRGTNWRISVSGQTVTLHVESTAGVAITAGGGAISMPAATHTCALDPRGNPFITDVKIHLDYSAQYDDIRVEGNNPLTAITLDVNLANGVPSHGGSPAPTTALVTGWDPTLNSGWYPGLLNLNYQFVYARYYLNPTWQGTQYNDMTAGLRNKRTLDASGSITGQPFGVGGYTGARSYDSTYESSNARCTIDTITPLSPNGSVANVAQGFLSPLIFVAMPDGTFLDRTDSFSIAVENNPPGITLSGDMGEIQGLIDPALGYGATFLFTVGIRESMPLMASWQRPVAGWARDLPRKITKRIPHLEEWTVLHGTVLHVGDGAGGTVSDGAVLVTSGGGTVIDDKPKLWSHLAFMRYWLSQPGAEASWIDHSQIDISYASGAFFPGAFLTTAHDGVSAVAVGGCITARRWEFQRGASYGTYYSCARIVPDVDSIVTNPHIYRMVRAAEQRIAELGQ